RDAKYGFAVSISWMILCVTGAVFTALAGLAYFQQNGPQLLTDTTNGESVFLDLAQILVHPLIPGVLLAALLAAIIATISSQLLVSSPALSEGLVAAVGVALSDGAGRWGGRIGVLTVSVIAVVLAPAPGSPVLGLLAFPWAGF